MYFIFCIVGNKMRIKFFTCWIPFHILLKLGSWIFMLTLLHLQSIDESIHVTSDEKVCIEFSWSWFIKNILSDLTIFICFYRKKCKDGLAYGMEFKSHVTYSLGNSVRIQRTICWSSSPIIHPLEQANFSINSLVGSDVDLGRLLG